jgi:hypothetical protein
MRITESRIRQIIREEARRVLREGEDLGAHRDDLLKRIEDARRQGDNDRVYDLKLELEKLDDQIADEKVHSAKANVTARGLKGRYGSLPEMLRKIRDMALAGSGKGQAMSDETLGQIADMAGDMATSIESGGGLSESTFHRRRK